MTWIRREWTASEAEEWSLEDLWTWILSTVAYILLTIGVGLCFLQPLWGALCLIVAGLAGGFMYWIIDPKLRAVSQEYETKQVDYLRSLDDVMKWKE